MFLTGQIVKSKVRTEKYPYFVMVLDDPQPSQTQFKGVVLKCISADGELDQDEKAGYVTDVFNTHMWELSSLEEMVNTETTNFRNDIIWNIVQIILYVSLAVIFWWYMHHNNLI